MTKLPLWPIFAFIISVVAVGALVLMFLQALMMFS